MSADRIGWEFLRVARDGGVLVVRLSRPKRRNAMCLPMRRELLTCVGSAEGDDDIEAVVLTGDGHDAFSAGADIEELEARTVASELSRQAQVRRDLPRLMETLSKPVVAAIGGWCLGAGLELALACTIRIAAEDARLGLPEINLGVIPGSGGTQRLTRLVGIGRALEMVLTGDPVDAAKAERIGLVTAVVTRDQLIPAAIDQARRLGSKPRTAFAAGRDAVLAASDLDLIAGIEVERRLFALCIAMGDKDDRVQAFLRRRDSRRSGGKDGRS